MKYNRFTSVALGALIASSPVVAQAEATLTAKGGAFTISGEILSANDGMIIINTASGEMSVRADVVDCEGQGCPGGDAPAEAADGQVVLQDASGTLKIEGELLELDENTFFIRTASGDLTVSRAMMSCVSGACPGAEDSGAESSEFFVVAPSEGGFEMMSHVMASYADSKGLSITESFGEAESEILLGDDSGNLLTDMHLTTRGTKEALAALFAGKASLAMTRMEATPQMLAELTGTSVSDIHDVLDVQIFGLDALSVINHPSNPIDALSVDDVRGILSGEITNWSQLGGADRAIVLHLGANGSELSQLVGQAFGSAEGVQDRLLRHDRAESIDAVVLEQEGALGITYRSAVDNSQTIGLSSACRIYYGDSDFAVQSGEYPFAVNLYGYSLKDETLDESADAIFGYLATDDGQEKFAEIGLVSQAVHVAPMMEQGSHVLSALLSTQTDRAMDGKLRSYLDAVSKGKRLSSSLHFVAGSRQLDDRAVQDIERVSNYIKEQTGKGLKLTVVGFSDAVGKFDANVALSQGRAAAIKDAILERNPGWISDADIEVIGAGPIAPVDCNDTAEGQERNRRAEIWISPRRS